MRATTARQNLIKRVNRKTWWRTCFPSKQAILERGLFFVSSFEEAEFYGRPLDTPFRVTIANPVIGSFTCIQKQLLGKPVAYADNVKAIFAHDKLLKKRALAKGFDSIIVLTTSGFNKFEREKILPRSMELNVFDAHKARHGTLTTNIAI